MSHFSFTRNSGDACALDQKNKESSAPFDWTTDSTIRESSQSCFYATAPFSHNPYKSIPKESIDVESELRGQTRLLSKCINDKYVPNSSNAKWSINECKDIRLASEYTRVDKSCNLAGITINRFQPLCDDAQSPTQIHNNAYTGVNTRLLVKDATKKYKNTSPFTLDTKNPCDMYGTQCAFVIPDKM
jgi:hypothetical protein